jgi:hypothetical protein
MNSHIVFNAMQFIIVGMECVEYRFYLSELTLYKLINKTNGLYM